MYYQRTLETFLLKATQQFPILLVAGPRQVGKTTFLKHLSEGKYTYVTLDDPLLASLAKEDPKLFLERFKPPLFIDEIQYAPELFPYIKMIVDENRQPGQFWMTGSQQFLLMKGVSESLAGRIGILNLLGLSLWEAQDKARLGTPFLPDQKILEERMAGGNKFSLKEVYFNIWRGSYPAIALNPDIDHTLFYSSYVQTYLQRDVRDLAHVGDQNSFFRFLRATAARTGQLLNITELARDADISPSTAKSWLSILEASHLLYFLHPYFDNINKRMIKSPKLYFLDTGLCCYLTEWSSPETLEAGAMAGSIFETYIVAEVLKSYWHNGKQAPLYYYRDKDKKEINLLVYQDKMLYPVEIKKTGSPNRGATRHFQLIDKLNIKRGEGGIVCFTDKLIPLSKDDTAIPAYLV
ncbi:MAG: ATPase [Alphaproteobacteria bacterium 41-28]|nr:MAG: ATPase [Alphaproteobacteria bacterium 41-28]